MGAGWYLTGEEAARALGVSPLTIRRYRAAGKLRAEEIDGCSLYGMEEVLRLRRERRRLGSMMTAREAGRLLHLAPETVRNEAARGKLAHEWEGEPRRSTMRLQYQDVIAYWQEHMGRVCFRCGILGEATAEQGFRCAACVYEEQTGRIYRWPTCPPYHPGAMVRGKLALAGR